MIQPDGEAEQLSLDYREKANDYRATIERLSDRRQHKLPLRQLLAKDADKNRKRKPPDPQNIGFGGFCVCGVLP